MFNYDLNDVIGKIVVQHAYGYHAKKVGFVVGDDFDKLADKDGNEYSIRVVIVREIHEGEDDRFFTINVDHIGFQQSKHHSDVFEFFP